MARIDGERFIGLEWLRFLLALHIVLFHTFHEYGGHPHTRWLDELSGLGFFATSSFFVLSGFLLTHVYSGNGQLREPARSFLGKRLANLYPLHLASLGLTALVLLAIGTLGIPPDDAKATVRFVVYDTNEDLGDLPRETLEHFMGNGELLLNLLLQLFMLQAWNPYYLSFNPPLWSVSTLFFFYLCFPLLAPRLMGLRHKGWALAAVVLLYLLPPLWAIQQQAFGMPVTGLLHRNPLLRLPEFAAGILLYGLYRRHAEAGRLPAGGLRAILAGFVAGSMLLAGWLLKAGSPWYYLLHNGLLLPAQLALIYLCAQARVADTPRLTRWAQRLAMASLPLFVLHVPGFILFSRSERMVAALRLDCLPDWPGCVAQAGEQALSLWLYPLYLVLIVAFCVWLQERAVRPARRWLLRRMHLGR